MAPLLIGNLLRRVTGHFIQEADLIGGVQEQVEFVESELKMMYAVLQDVETKEGPSDHLLRWNEAVEKINLYADNAIEQFITSAGYRGLLFLFRYIKDRHDVEMQLNRIMAIIRQMPDSNNTSIWEMTDNLNKSTGSNSLFMFFQQQIQANDLLMLLNFNKALKKAGNYDKSLGHNGIEFTFVSSFVQGMKKLPSRISDLILCCKCGAPSHNYGISKLQLIKGELDSMLSQFQDVEGMEGLDKRQMIWRAQLKDADRQLQDFLQKNPKGFLCRIIFPGKIKQQVAQIECNHEALNRRKQNYDIELPVQNRGHKPVGQSCQEQEPSSSISLEENQPCSSNHGTKSKLCDSNPSQIITSEEDFQSGGKEKEKEDEEEAQPSWLIRGSLRSSIISRDKSRHSGVRSIMYKIRNWSSFQSIQKLKVQVESMEAEVKLMRALLEDVHTIEKPSRMKVWLEEIEEIADEAEQAISDYYETVNQIGFLAPPMILNKVAKAITRIMNKIHDVSKRREASDTTFHSLCQRGSLPNIIGFTDDARAIKERLLARDSQCCVIAVLGEVGAGKTTLANAIYSDGEVMKRFTLRAWVPVPQDNSCTAVVQEIRLQFKGCVKENGERTMGVEIHGSYLIILDDIQTAEVLDLIRKEFPDRSNGSRIVVTTKEKAIALSADSNEDPHEIQLLSDKESWELFTSTLKVKIPPHVEKIGKEIVRRCGRLRRNTVVIGNLLSKSPVNRANFFRVLKELDKGWTPWQKAKNAYIELGRDLRKCLDYFRLFPDQFATPARRLTALWVAEGFVNKRMGDEPEYIAKRYLNELIEKKLVEVVEKKFNGDVKTCRLSKDGAELLQEYASATSQFSSNQEISRFADHCDPNNVHSKHIHDHDVYATLTSYYKKVLTFMSFDHAQGSKPGIDVKIFLRRCISNRCFLLLRVLDLERVFRPKFPSAFGKLLQLRYLGLRWTLLEELPPSVSNLLKLQTLDLDHTYISKLPQSIWKMQRLRHLYLSESYRSRFDHKHPAAGTLKELQTLWGVFIDERSLVKRRLDTLENLRKLGLACRTLFSQKKQMLLQIDAVADWIRKLKYLQSLRLRSYDEHGDPWFLPLKGLSELENLSTVNLLGRLRSQFVKSGIPKGVTYLTLSASGLKKDPMQMLQYLHKLKNLRLLSNSYRGKRMHCSSSSFPDLQVLRLWKLEHLQQWTMDNDALPQLTDLELRSCRQLAMLPIEIQHMGNLKVLNLVDLKIDTIDCSSTSFPQLQVLKLETLEYPDIWIEDGALPQLRELEIISCRFFNNILEEFQHLKNLETLKLEDMDFDKRIHCPKTSFPQLQILKLKNLKRLKKWTMEEGALPQLAELEIISCRKLHMLFDGLQHISSLKVLKVKEMPLKFTHRLQKDHAWIGTKLQTLP